MCHIVEQFDYHLPFLTVKETLTFHAQMRLPIQTSPESIQIRVIHVMKQLGLISCASVKVGSSEHKGISGGEKRRLSIGVQLLSDPRIFLFDEPTSGLDAFTARHIILNLKNLTKRDKHSNTSALRTILLSIHQPRYDIFALIDQVILLSRGSLIWSGHVKDMLAHFSSLNFTCPKLINPADYILDLSSIDVNDLFHFVYSQTLISFFL